MASYTKCSKCWFIYNSELDSCPECGALNNISEELDNSTVFNIND